jgi:hypothetical protein
VLGEINARIRSLDEDILGYDRRLEAIARHSEPVPLVSDRIQNRISCLSCTSVSSTGAMSVSS